MKYAKEVIDLLGAFPGRPFKMAQIVRYISPGAAGLEREAIRKGVARAIDALEESGVVVVETSTSSKLNSPASYKWKSGTSEN